MHKKSRFKKFFIFLVLLLVGGGLFSFLGTALRERLFFLTSPLLRLQHYIGRSGAGETPAEHNEEWRAVADAHNKELERELESLRELMGIKHETRIESRAVNVLAYRKEFGREALIIDQGSSVGINTGDVAVDHHGFIVGSIREVGEHSAKVSVATNTGEAYEIEFLPIKEKGLARGMGGGIFNVELIPSDFTIRKGDFIMVSLGGKNFFLGEIVREEPNGGAALKVARAFLLARPDTLDEVLIIAQKNVIPPQK